MDRRVREHAEKCFEREKTINKHFAQDGKHDLILILDHLKPDFNIGKIFRTAEAFSIKEIYLVGINFFDPTPALRTFKRVKAHFVKDFQECYDDIKSKGYNIFALETSNNSKLMHEVQFPKNSAFIVGHEQRGISFDIKNFPDIQSVYIEQFGLIESLNVSIAASIAMYEYLGQHVLRKKKVRPNVLNAPTL